MAVTTGLALAGCGDRTPAADCGDCGRLVIAAVGDPPAVLPPLVQETVGRDIGDLVFERLVTLEPGGAPVDSAAWRPALASAWTRVDDRRIRFTLRDGARWHDGRPVTADDVVFSLAAWQDTAIGAPGLPALDGVTALAEDARTVTLAHPTGSPELLYDLAYGLRIVPRHVWGARPAAEWAADTALASLVGSGPYRIAEWRRGEYLRLVADTARTPRPAIDTLVWRFTPAPDAAATLLLAHEADVMENLLTPPNVQRIAADSTLAVLRHPSAAYGFLAYRVADARGRAHPLLGEAAVRRALALAVPRQAIATAVFGEGTAVPQGPISQASWLHEPARPVPPADTAAASRALDEAGFARGADGVRARGATRLAFEVLVPASSGSRVALAQALQEAWRGVGVAVTVQAVEFPIFQQRLAQGRFDAYIGAYLDEPSPRGLAVQWGTSGIGQLNHGRWSHPAFDALLAEAAAATDAATARARYRAALDTLEHQAPALFLYAPSAAMGVKRRVTVAQPADPFAWLARVGEWRKGAVTRE